MKQTLYYFAFGSNLNHYRLHQRIGDYQTYGIGYLKDHKLVFNKRGGDESGKCTVVESAADKVWGAICQISVVQKEKLDYFEGVGHGYDAVTKKIISAEQTMDVVLYQATLDAMDEGLSPFEWYKDFVITGAKHHGLPSDYIRLIDNVSTIADPDQGRVELNQKTLLGDYLI